MEDLILNKWGIGGGGDPAMKFMIDKGCGCWTIQTDDISFSTRKNV